MNNQQLESFLYDLLGRVASDPKTTPKLTVSNKSVLVGKRRVYIRPNAEASRAIANRYLAGIRFEISVDEKPVANLTAGTVGVGESMESAQKVAVAEWYLQFGNTLFAALSEQTPSFRVGGFSVYTGPLGLRVSLASKSQPPGLPTAQQLLAAIESQLPKPDGSVHCIILNLALDGNTKSDGEIRIDGNVSPQALNPLLRLPWPANSMPLMYKQVFYLL